MIKIRVENAYTNEVFETECDGALISTHQRKGNNCVTHSIAIGRLSQFQVLCKPSLWCRIEIH